MPESIDHRDGPRDECGVFGIYAPERDVSRLAYFALFALQHRGQESAGIATAVRGGDIMAVVDQGLVAQVFDEHMLPHPARSSMLSDALLLDAVRQGWMSPPISVGRGPPERKPVMTIDKLLTDLDRDRADR